MACTWSSAANLDVRAVTGVELADDKVGGLGLEHVDEHWAVAGDDHAIRVTPRFRRAAVPRGLRHLQKPKLTASRASLQAMMV